MKKSIAAVVLCILLAGCAARPVPDVPEASETSEASSAAPSEAPAKVPPKPESVPGTPPEAPAESAPTLRTADETIALFCDALKNGDLDMLYQTVLAEKGRLNYWKGAKISDATFTAREKFDQAGVYDVVLTVSDAYKIPLKTGENRMVARVEMPAFSNWDQLYVTMLAPADKYIPLEVWTNDPAISSVMSWRAWHNGGDLFDSTGEIDKEGLLDYVIVLASHAFSEKPNEPVYSLTQEQINATVKKHFGLDSLIKTDSRMYNKETRRYELFGSDGSYERMRPVRVEELPDGGRVIYVETYKDPLELIAKTAYQYTMARNDDGAYRFVSASASKQ